MPSILNATTTAGVSVQGDNSGSLQLATNNGTTAVTIDTSQNVGIGTSSPNAPLDVIQKTSDSTYALQLRGYTTGADGTRTANIRAVDSSAGNWANMGSYATSWIWNYQGAAERMRIDSSGNLLVGTTSANPAVLNIAGAHIANNRNEFSVDGAVVAIVNRKTNDGELMQFRQDGTSEGNISVSGTTVSYNGGHLARWSQLPDNSKDDTILKGTVLTNLDDMCVWEKDGETLPNEQLNKMKVSDVEGDANVAGVFVNWTRDEDCQSDDMNVAMTGDMIIRIAEGVVVQKGDLLMSAGDGTAKPQNDDIRRSSTVAKVTSNHVTCTYEDGSYCVPCVLMAC